MCLPCVSNPGGYGSEGVKVTIALLSHFRQKLSAFLFNIFCVYDLIRGPGTPLGHSSPFSSWRFRFLRPPVRFRSLRPPVPQPLLQRHRRRRRASWVRQARRIWPSRNARAARTVTPRRGGSCPNLPPTPLPPLDLAGLQGRRSSCRARRLDSPPLPAWSSRWD